MMRFPSAIRPVVRRSLTQLYKSTASTEMPTEQSEAVKPFDSIPGPTGLAGMKYFGMRFLFAPFTKFTPETLHELWAHLHEKYGDIYRLRFSSTWVVFTANVDDVSSVLYHGGKYPYRRSFPLLEFTYKKTGIQPSLATLNGAAWYRLRQAVKGKLLSSRSATHYLGPQSDVTREFVRRIGETKYAPRQLVQEYYKFACESIGVVCFNTRMGCFSTDPAKEKEIDELITNLNTMFRLQFTTNTTFPLYKYMRTKIYDTYEKAFLAAYSVGKTSMDKALVDLKTKADAGTLDTEEPNLILSLLSSGQLSQEEVVGVSLDLFLGGMESTAVNLQMLLYNLAKNPEQQERLHQEVLEYMGPDGDLTAEALNKMSYLKACIRESLRLIFPTSSGMLRVLEDDVVMGGYRIPARTVVICNSRQMSGNPEYFEHPEKFLPERWLRDATGKRKTAIDSIASVPFGLGHRNCIGRRFAEQELYLAASKLVQAFKIKPGPTFKDPELIYHTFVRSRDPIDLQFEPRK